MSILVKIETDSRQAFADVNRLESSLDRFKRRVEIPLGIAKPDTKALDDTVANLKRTKIDLKPSISSAQAEASLKKLKDSISGSIVNPRPTNQSLESIRGSAEATKQSLGSMGASFGQSSSAIKSAAASVGLALSGILVANSFTRMHDDIIQTAGSFAIMGKSIGEASRAYTDIVHIAQTTRSSFGNIQGLFSNLSKAALQFGDDATNVAKITETVAKTLSLTVSPAQSVDSALQQFFQTMRGGVAQAEEWNSIMEAIPELAESVARGLGIPFGSLKALIGTGSLNASQLFKALDADSKRVSENFEKMGITFAGAFRQVSTTISILQHSLVKLGGTGPGLADWINSAALAVGRFALELPHKFFLMEVEAFLFADGIYSSFKGIGDYLQKEFDKISVTPLFVALGAVGSRLRETADLLKTLVSSPIKFDLFGIDAAIQTFARFKAALLAGQQDKNAASLLEKPERAPVDITTKLPAVVNDAISFISRFIEGVFANIGPTAKGVFNTLAASASVAGGYLIKAFDFVSGSLKRIGSSFAFALDSLVYTISKHNDTFSNFVDQAKSVLGVSKYKGPGPYKDAAEQPFGHNVLNLLQQDTILKGLLGAGAAVGSLIALAFSTKMLGEGPTLALALGGATALAFGTLISNSVFPETIQRFALDMASSTAASVAKITRFVIGDVFGSGTFADLTAGLKSVAIAIVGMALLFQGGRASVGKAVVGAITAPTRVATVAADAAALRTITRVVERQADSIKVITDGTARLKDAMGEATKNLARASQASTTANNLTAPAGASAAASARIAQAQAQATVALNTARAQAATAKSAYDTFTANNKQALADQTAIFNKNDKLRGTLEASVSDAKERFRSGAVTTGASLGGAFGAIGGLQLGQEIAEGMGDAPAWKKIGVTIGSSIMFQALGAGLGSILAQTAVSAIGIGLSLLMSPFVLAMGGIALAIAAILNFDTLKAIFVDTVLPALKTGFTELIKVLDSLLTYVSKDLVPALWAAVPSLWAAMTGGKKDKPKDAIVGASAKADEKPEKVTALPPLAPTLIFPGGAPTPDAAIAASNAETIAATSNFLAELWKPLEDSFSGVGRGISKMLDSLESSVPANVKSAWRSLVTSAVETAAIAATLTGVVTQSYKTWNGSIASILPSAATLRGHLLNLELAVVGMLPTLGRFGPAIAAAVAVLTTGLAAFFTSPVWITAAVAAVAVGGYMFVKAYGAQTWDWIKSFFIAPPPPTPPTPRNPALDQIPKKAPAIELAPGVPATARSFDALRTVTPRGLGLGPVADKEKGLPAGSPSIDIAKLAPALNSSKPLIFDAKTATTAEAETARAVILKHEIELLAEFKGLTKVNKEDGGGTFRVGGDTSADTIHYPDLAKVPVEKLTYAYTTMLHEFGHVYRAQKLGYAPLQSRADRVKVAEKDDYTAKTGGVLREEAAANLLSQSLARVVGPAKATYVDESRMRDTVSYFTKQGHRSGEKRNIDTELPTAIESLRDALLYAAGPNGALDLEKATVTFDSTGYLDAFASYAGTEIALSKILDNNIVTALQKIPAAVSKDSFLQDKALNSIGVPQTFGTLIAGDGTNLSEQLSASAGDTRLREILAATKPQPPLATEEATRPIVIAVAKVESALKPLTVPPAIGSTVTTTATTGSVNVASSAANTTTPLAATPAADAGIKAKAILARTIRTLESGDREVGWSPSGSFKYDPAQGHPRRKSPVAGTNLTSDAAGPYQFLSSTWDDEIAIMNRKGIKIDGGNFSRENNDAVFYHKIERMGVTADMAATDMAGVIKLLNKTWVALPGSGSHGEVSQKRFDGAFAAATRTVTGTEGVAAQTLVSSQSDLARSTLTISGLLEKVQSVGYVFSVKDFIKDLMAAVSNSAVGAGGRARETVTSLTERFSGTSPENFAAEINKAFEKVNFVVSGSEIKSMTEPVLQGFLANVDQLNAYLNTKVKAGSVDELALNAKIQSAAAVLTKTTESLKANHEDLTTASTTLEQSLASITDPAKAVQVINEALVTFGTDLTGKALTITDKELPNVIKSIKALDEAIMIKAKLIKAEPSVIRTSLLGQNRDNVAVITEPTKAPVRVPSASPGAAAAGKKLVGDARGIASQELSKALHADEERKTIADKLAGSVIDSFISGVTKSLFDTKGLLGSVFNSIGIGVEGLGSTIGGVFNDKGSAEGIADMKASDYEFNQGVKDFKSAVSSFVDSVTGRTPKSPDGAPSTSPAAGGILSSDSAGKEQAPEVVLATGFGKMKGGFDKLSTVFTSTNMSMSDRITGGLRGVGDIFSGGLGGLLTMLQGAFSSLISTVVTSSAISSGGGGGGLLALLFGGGSGGGSVGGSSAVLTAATGGYIAGAGTGTSDSISAMLSNGEFVINAESTKKHRGLLQSINEGKLSKFATGGIVGQAPTMTYSAPASAVNSVVQGAATVAPVPQRPQQEINISITGDISRQTRKEIYEMLPTIANGVNSHNREKGYRG